MEAMLATGSVEAAVLSDPSADMLAAARTLAPDAAVVGSLDAMLAQGLDGIVIATPSGLHAEQSIRALESGIAVFCQKPLGRNADEAARVVAAARTADRLLSVDFSYRFTTGMNRIAELVRTGALGNIYAVDLTFHNAYGPDKPWFYDRAQSGGGCVMDLGVHLVDLALWVLGFPDVTTDISAALFAQGAPLITLDRTEDYAVASFTLETGTIVRLACSWRLHAGVDARIEVAFYGTKGGAAMRNVDGSFYDFRTERFTGTGTEIVAKAPDDWGGRAAADWARRLHADQGFDPAAERLVSVATVIDRIYAVV
jgi:predicted dehydrogenase